MRKWKILLALTLIYTSSLGVRLIPSIYYDLPYGYDFWEGLMHLGPIIENGHFSSAPPQGPIFYLLLVGASLILGPKVFTVFTYFVPFASSAAIFFVYLFTRKIANENSALIAALITAAAGIFVHQTTLPVPESLGLTFLALFIYLLYTAITEGNVRKFFLLMLIAIIIVLTHHLTSFFMLLTLALLCPVVLASKKLSLKMLTPVIIFFASLLLTSVWWFFGIPVVSMFFEFIFEASAESWILGAILALICLFLGYRVVFGWEKLRTYFAGREIKISLIITLTFAIGFAIATSLWLPMAIEYHLSPLYQIYYTLPYAAALLFPGLIGLFIHYNKTKESWKRFYPIAWIIAPLASACFLLASSSWGALSYRHLAFIFLGAFPMVGYGYHFICKTGDPKLRLVKGFTIAYFALLIGLLSFPPPQFLVGLDEAYYYPEVQAANWIPNYIPKPTTFDSDHRMGVVIRFTTGQRVYLGNETSWLGEVSQMGSITQINQTIKYLVITETMLKYTVVGGFLRESKPLPATATDYLNRSPSITRAYSSNLVTIYKKS